jgi:hypothetical protein
MSNDAGPPNETSVNSITLSRLNITGSVDDRTPICVLEEILSSVGIDPIRNPDLNSRDYSLSLLKQIKVNASVTVEKDRNLRKYWNVLARYVEGGRRVVYRNKWNKRTLMKAYKFLQMLEDESNLEQIVNEFTVGNQNPDNIYNINVCVLYAMCKRAQIETEYNMTEEQLEGLAREYITDQDCDYLQNAIIQDLTEYQYDLGTLYKMLKILGKHPYDNETEIKKNL